MSELDKRIAASVARGEAAIARQEAAVAKQEEGHVRFDAVMRDWAEQAKREEAELAELKAMTAELAAERREEKDERRAVLEALLRMIDRLPPPQTAS